MLRVGIVGSGFMGRTHAAAWRATPAQIVGIHSLDSSSAQHLAAAVGSHAYETLDALIADTDVLDVCTPTHLHHAMVLQIAAAGKHIICEKPLALTVAQAGEMLAACESAGVQLLAAHVVRFFPEYALAKATVERGDIGKVAIIRLTRCSFKPAANRPESWFDDPTKSGGMMMDLMIHDFDYARWVAGDVESVFAKGVRAANPNAPLDYSITILQHKNGALSNIEGGWAYPQPMFRTALEIAGDRGLIEHPAARALPLEIYMHRRDLQEVDVGVPSSPLTEDPYTTQIKHFYEVLTRGITPRVTAADGFEAVRIARGAIHSATTGKRVQLEEIV